MANRFWNYTVQLIANTLAKAEEVAASLEGIETGLNDVETELDRAIQITSTPGTTAISLNAAARALKILSFDTSGDVVAIDDIGDWQGNHTAITDYLGRDLVKDANGDLGLNNIYRCNTPHESTADMNDDSAKWDLVVDVTDSVAAALLSQQWASLTTGVVAATDYSSKAYAIGGTGVTGAAGASKEWAINAHGAAVDGGTGYSALHWATESATSAAAAAASFLEFDKIYLGAFAVPPTVDNQGDPLVEGQLYYDTAVDKMYVRSSISTWIVTTANAVDVAITDTLDIYASTDVENALQEIAVARDGRNLVRNGSFELGLQNWTVTPTGTGTASVITTDSGKGKKCLKVELPNIGDEVSLLSEFFDINPHRDFFLSIMALWDGATKLSLYDVYLDTYTKADVFVASYHIRNALTSSGWDELSSVEEATGIGATEVRGRLRLEVAEFVSNAPVTSYYDDLHLATLIHGFDVGIDDPYSKWSGGTVQHMANILGSTAGAAAVGAANTWEDFTSTNVQGALVELHAQIESAGYSLIKNGSFESDEAVSDVPDGWTLTEETGATVGTNTVPSHGARSLLFQATTNGGGTAESDLFPVRDGALVTVKWDMWASDVDSLNKVQINWKTSAGGSVGTSALYSNQVDNPTGDFHTKSASVMAPGTASQATITITGVDPAGPTATSTWTRFDNVIVTQAGNPAETHTLASNGDSVELTNLLFAADEVIDVEFEIVGVSGAGSTFDLVLNGDTTGTNYYRDTVGGASSNDNLLASLNSLETTYGQMKLFKNAKLDQICALITIAQATSSTLTTETISIVYNVTAALTSIQIITPAATSMDDGTFIRLLRR